ncbi:hypothetical protein ACI2K4_20220 [Micromonospora sp. NPDC050397]
MELLELPVRLGLLTAETNRTGRLSRVGIPVSSVRADGDSL